MTKKRNRQARELSVGDHVEWKGDRAHLGCWSPFEICDIDNEGWATLKWVSIPVRLSDLAQVPKSSVRLTGLRMKRKKQLS